MSRYINLAKKLRLAKKGRQTRWAPFWLVPKVYGKANLDKASLGQLIDLISNTELQAESENSKDLPI